MRSNEEILHLWRDRKEAKGPHIARMDEIDKAYHGALVLPLPEMDKVEKSAVANLISQGIDQLGARVSSVRPDVDCPSTNPGQEKADKLSRERRMAILGWWDKSEHEILDGKRARHLLAYGSSPIQVKPGMSKDAEIPTWHVRSPLAAFPGGNPNGDAMTPADCIFSYEVTLGFLQRNYSDAISGLEKGDSPSPDTKFEILEYVDEDLVVMLAVGKSGVRQTAGYGPVYTAGAPLAQLMRVPNRAGTCTVVVPTRTSLDMPIGKFDGMTGMYYTQSKLMALTLIAVERGVFPKEWLVGRPGELPEVLQEADPANGITGTLSGGTLEVPTVQPSYITYQTMQLLEQAQRQQGGLPQELGGESPTNVRTGKRGADILSAQMDFPIQEAQTALARSKEHENEIAIAIAKGYFGSKSVSFYVRRMKGAKGQVTYTPNQTFTSDVNFVTYPHAGSDANQLAVLLGQLIQLELISEDTGRQLHPLIDDPHHEAQMVQSEALNKALLASIAQQVQAGTLSAVDVAKITLQINEDKSDLAHAYITVHEAEQERQAGAEQDQGAPPGGPPQPGGQPGLAPGPGGQPGGAQVPPTVGAPPPSGANLAAILSQLHQGATSPQPAGAPAAA